ncbi:integrase core domain-containing protein [Streptomyces sp. NPDC090114]|uniref:integrase core domain-containing protein n=1 Tax=Streptomyces sp. NPDC090114 TaxID=3365950 RepID=UPI00381523CD
MAHIYKPCCRRTRSLYLRSLRLKGATGHSWVRLVDLAHPGWASRNSAWASLSSQVELATAEWIDWYNHRRLHGERGHIPPVGYEASYYTELTKPQVITTI